MYFAMVLYLFAAAIVGLIGRNTAAGFIGMFLLSIIVSPLLALIFLFLMRPNKRERLRLEKARLEEELRQSHRQTL